MNKTLKMWRLIGLSLLTLHVAFVVVMTGCSPAQPQKPTVQPAPVSFSSQQALMFACTNEYEIGEKWYNLRKTINVRSPNEIQKWLTLQQAILVDQTNVYVGLSLHRKAIQEFRHFSDHAEPFRPWLESCKTNGLFADPFLDGNLTIILDDMNAKKK